MKANELRLGNHVNYMGREQIVTSEMIRECELNNATTQPITLTEEWLVKFGFKNYDENKWEFEGIVILKYDEGCIYLSNQRHVNIFYIHQLQNLYFALTGQELEITQ